MNHIARASFAITAYLVGLLGLSYFFLYLGGWEFLPRSLDATSTDAPGWSLAINLGLVVLFGLQHSVMARPAFKKRWTRLIPADLERSAYVLISGLFMFAFALFWQPMNGLVWSIDGSGLTAVFRTLYVLGFAIVVAASFMIDHFELFGLRQVYERIKGKQPETLEFTEVLLYGVVRHPIQLGLLMCMWFAPVMSASHLLLASTMTVYIFIGLYFEERDLVATFGARYRNYRRRVRQVLPLPKLRAPKPSTAATNQIAERRS